MQTLTKILATLALLVAMLLDTVNVHAQTAYDLYICGTQVTDTNKGNLKEISGVTGTSATYNSDTKTLRLEDASITVSGEVRGILSGIEGLKIEVVGNDTINSNGWSAIELHDSTNILGSGTLIVNNPSNDHAAIWTCLGASLIIENCTLNVTGGKQGLGSGDNSGTLTINNATVTAKGTSIGSIHGFSAITLNGCFISKPVGAKISGGNVTDAIGNIIKDTVRIIPKYDLWICGTQVTDLNKNDLTTISGVSGTSVTYIPDTKTLRLINVNITSTVTNCIYSKIEGLKIEVADSNTLNSASLPAIKLDSNSSIEGSGTLNIHSGLSDAIYLNNASSLTIRNCTVNANGNKRGVFGTDGILNIDNATVTATGTVTGSITGISNITGCFISEPVGATFNAEEKAVCYASGNIVKETVKLIPAYDLWIWGTQVTSANCSNLAPLAGATEGSITYDPSTNTLTLDSVNSANKTGDQNMIKSSIEGLKIDVVGENTLKAHSLHITIVR